MSRLLRDFAIWNFQKIIFLMEKGKFNEALEELKKAEEASQKAKADKMYLFYIQTMKGHIMMDSGEYKEALKIFVLLLNTSEELISEIYEDNFYKSIFIFNLNNIFLLGEKFLRRGMFLKAENCFELHFSISEKLLKKDPKNLAYQFYAGNSLHNLGLLLKNIGRIEEAKQRYLKALEIRNRLLERDQNNKTYRSYVGMTLLNLGNLFWDIRCIEEAKQMFEKAFENFESHSLKDPENLAYQYYLGVTLNSLGALLLHEGCIEEAKSRLEKALEIRKALLEKDPNNLDIQSSLANTLTNLAGLFDSIDRFDEAKQLYKKAFEIYEFLCKENPDEASYQLWAGCALNNLGSLNSFMSQNEEARLMYEKALEKFETISKKDSGNPTCQSYLSLILNNLGALMWKMGCIEEAKRRYNEALKIFTEPMDYTSIIKKSEAIIRLIELNYVEARNESNLLNKTKFLREALELRNEYKEFFTENELNHERELFTKLGLSIYIDLSIINVGFETDSRKRAEEYEKAIQAVEKLSEVEDDETVLKLCSSAACYLKGRKFINESLVYRKPKYELLRQAVEQFRIAKETYDKAEECFCIYMGLLDILGEVEGFEGVDIPKVKKLTLEIVETLPEKVSPNIKDIFINIPKILEEKNKIIRNELLTELEYEISGIEYKALENLFLNIIKNIEQYFEEPFSPMLIYENWKLKIIFDKPEKIKGKLTINAGNRIIFNRNLSIEEIEQSLIEIDYLKIGYFPQGKDEMSFTMLGMKTPVERSIDYFENIGRDNKTKILQWDLCNGVCLGYDLLIAAVQLKYHVYVEDSVVKLTTDDSYHWKIKAILDILKGEADIVIFPEFSIPFDYLKEIDQYAKDFGIIVVAGSHYVTEELLGNYGELFSLEFGEENLRKNISPIVTPSSKIIHNEKLLGAREERELFFEEGMKAGKVNHILKLRNDLRIGVMICYEYLNTELRNRLIPTCDVILVPQTNPNPERFYETAKNDINNPICSGNKAYIMANGIFTFGNKKEVVGGYTGIVSTLDKYSYKRQNEGIIRPVEVDGVTGVMEQFVLLTSINTGFNPARDTQLGQVPIKTKLINIFEESEILSDSRVNGKGFIELLEVIKNCEKRDELKELLNSVENKAIIKIFSPLMYKHIQDLKEHTLDEMKNKCRYILIPAK